MLTQAIGPPQFKKDKKNSKPEARVSVILTETGK
jgi:hypothetical protein